MLDACPMERDKSLKGACILDCIMNVPCLTIVKFEHKFTHANFIGAKGEFYFHLMEDVCSSLIPSYEMYIGMQSITFYRMCN